ncbi:MAG: 2-oxo-4-hydroxy-4-carboxy-5-ureidoimidazoline decarboxylase [Gemmatimonadaceae bacterium]
MADSQSTLSVAELDTMPESKASEVLQACCGATRWVSEMVRRRPFGTRDSVLFAADEVWRSLEPSDWLEAFSHHPRIGDRISASSHADRGSAWASTEQSRVARSGQGVREALAAANREYEQRFGHIYIVFATGKSAEEMLALARERLRNDPDVELGVAAEEQRKIMRLRLDKLLGEEAR